MKTPSTTIRNKPGKSVSLNHAIVLALLVLVSISSSVLNASPAAGEIEAGGMFAELRRRTEARRAAADAGVAAPVAAAAVAVVEDDNDDDENVDDTALDPAAAAGAVSPGDGGFDFAAHMPAHHPPAGPPNFAAIGKLTRAIGVLKVRIDEVRAVDGGPSAEINAYLARIEPFIDAWSVPLGITPMHKTSLYNALNAELKALVDSENEAGLRALIDHAGQPVIDWYERQDRLREYLMRNMAPILWLQYEGLKSPQRIVFLKLVFDLGSRDDADDAFRAEQTAAGIDWLAIKNALNGDPGGVDFARFLPAHAAIMDYIISNDPASRPIDFTAYNQDTVIPLGRWYIGVIGEKKGWKTNKDKKMVYDTLQRAYELAEEEANAEPAGEPGATVWGRLKPLIERYSTLVAAAPRATQEEIVTDIGSDVEAGIIRVFPAAERAEARAAYRRYTEGRFGGRPLKETQFSPFGVVVSGRLVGVGQRMPTLFYAEVRKNGLTPAEFDHPDGLDEQKKNGRTKAVEGLWNTLLGIPGVGEADATEGLDLSKRRPRTRAITPEMRKAMRRQFTYSLARSIGLTIDFEEALKELKDHITATRAAAPAAAVVAYMDRVEPFVDAWAAGARDVTDKQRNAVITALTPQLRAVLFRDLATGARLHALAALIDNAGVPVGDHPGDGGFDYGSHMPANHPEDPDDPFVSERELVREFMIWLSGKVPNPDWEVGSPPAVKRYIPATQTAVPMVDGSKADSFVVSRYNAAKASRLAERKSLHPGDDGWRLDANAAVAEKHWRVRAVLGDIARRVSYEAVAGDALAAGLQRAAAATKFGQLMEALRVRLRAPGDVDLRIPISLAEGADAHIERFASSGKQHDLLQYWDVLAVNGRSPEVVTANLDHRDLIWLRLLGEELPLGEAPMVITPGTPEAESVNDFRAAIAAIPAPVRPSVLQKAKRIALDLMLGNFVSRIRDEHALIRMELARRYVERVDGRAGGRVALAPMSMTQTTLHQLFDNAVATWADIQARMLRLEDDEDDAPAGMAPAAPERVSAVTLLTAELPALQAAEQARLDEEAAAAAAEAVVGVPAHGAGGVRQRGGVPLPGAHQVDWRAGLRAVPADARARVAVVDPVAVAAAALRRAAGGPAWGGTDILFAAETAEGPRPLAQTRDVTIHNPWHGLFQGFWNDAFQSDRVPGAGAVALGGNPGDPSRTSYLVARYLFNYLLLVKRVLDDATIPEADKHAAIRDLAGARAPQPISRRGFVDHYWGFKNVVFAEAFDAADTPLGVQIREHYKKYLAILAAYLAETAEHSDRVGREGAVDAGDHPGVLRLDQAEFTGVLAGVAADSAAEAPPGTPRKLWHDAWAGAAPADLGARVAEIRELMRQMYQYLYKPTGAAAYTLVADPPAGPGLVLDAPFLLPAAGAAGAD